MGNILIVEDDKGINELIRRSLTLVGHDGFQAYSGQEAVDLASKEDIDLVLLDINLPDLDGFHLIRFLEGVPVIYVTARDGVNDKVKGLNAGAEDYIVKPFHMDELLARVQVVMRRFQKEQKRYLIGDAEIDLETHVVALCGMAVNLTNQEFELLRALIIHKNVALSRTKLLEFAWGMGYDGEERTVDVHVQRLRKKLKLENHIKTVFKVGYRLEL